MCVNANRIRPYIQLNGTERDDCMCDSYVGYHMNCDHRVASQLRERLSVTRCVLLVLSYEITSHSLWAPLLRACMCAYENRQCTTDSNPAVDSLSVNAIRFEVFGLFVTAR